MPIPSVRRRRCIGDVRCPPDRRYRPTLEITSVDSRLKSNVDRLQEFLNALVGAFSTQTRLLDAAKWGSCVGKDTEIGTDHAGLQLLTHPQDSRGVAGENVTGQSDGDGVGDGQSLFLGAEGDNRGDGTEDLFLRNACFT